MPAILAPCYTERTQASECRLRKQITLLPYPWTSDLLSMVTITMLYFLCLYLLKDAVLLEAQRNSPDPNEEIRLKGC
jgi:hypothetical protein